MGRRKNRIIPAIQPPPELKEATDKAWAEDPTLQEWNAKIDDFEARIKKLEKSLEAVENEAARKAEDAYKGFRAKSMELRELKLEMNREKAKRNTHKNKIYRKIEKDFITGIRKGIGIKQTWGDPMMKRALQREGVRKAKKGADVSEL